MTSLLSLSIENFVLIDRAQIEFTPQLTIVSGETGAGKSLFLRALNFLLGARLAAIDVVAKGQKKARVEALFQISDEATRKELMELGLGDDWDEDQLVLERSMDANGRSRVRLAGRLGTLSTLRKIAARLVTIVSQHAYQELIRDETQTHLLDDFGGSREARKAFEEERRNALRIRQDIDELKERQHEQNRYIQQCREDLVFLTRLNPKESEFEELAREAERLRRAEDFRQRFHSVIDLLSEREPSIVEQLRLSQRRIEDLGELFQPAQDAFENIERAVDEINEAVQQLSRAEQSIDDDPERLHDIEQRIGAYKDAARRIRVIPERLHEERERLESVVSDDISSQISALQGRLERLSQSLKLMDNELSEKRRVAAKALQKAVLESVRALGMPKARFQVEVAKMPEQPPLIPEANGSAQVQFIFAANPGEVLRPIGDVASGGELSRLMLALQRHLAQALKVGLLVFDEIDQNVGGRLGFTIGRELAALARERQVLVISHLPQVAAFADTHVLVEKDMKDEHTRSHFRELEAKDRTREIAAMTRGQDITDAALTEAKEMLDEAEKFKNQLPKRRSSSSATKRSASKAKSSGKTRRRKKAPSKNVPA